jgi:acyl dehydratase
MALDPSFVGRTYLPTEPYTVSREKIREFAAAIGATEAAHRDPAAAAALGYADLVAPPTFPVVVSMAANQALIDDPALGLDFSRGVHGDQRFAYTRPVQAGDSLVAASTVEEILSRGGHDFLTTRTEIATEVGEPVVTVWSRLVVRGEG